MLDTLTPAPPPPPPAAAREVASAMVFIHGKKVLHGDLTARNVLLTSSNKDRRHWI